MYCILQFKYYFSRHITISSQELSESKIKKGEKGVWQRRYWEHTIRNEKDLYKHLDYIHYNSMKHLNISPKDWEFSSFKKFVKQGFYQENWCNIDNKNDILNMDLE